MSILFFLNLKIKEIQYIFNNTTLLVLLVKAIFNFYAYIFYVDMLGFHVIIWALVWRCVYMFDILILCLIYLTSLLSLLIYIWFLVNIFSLRHQDVGLLCPSYSCSSYFFIRFITCLSPSGFYMTECPSFWHQTRNAVNARL